MESIVIKSSASGAARPGSDLPDDAGATSLHRMRVAKALLAVAVYAVFAGVHEAESALGLIDAGSSRALSVFMLCGALGFYGIVRSDANPRWLGYATVSQAQCLFGVLCAALAYAINGPTRGATLLIMLLILVFGMFTLPPPELRRVGIFSLLMLGGVMAWSSRADPSQRPPAVEFVHFLFASIGVVTVLILAGRLSAMRAALAGQKVQLEEMLERLHAVAIRDELTGLVNRRHMNARLETELARHERDGTSMSVALLDIDFFKQVNDRHGHRVGDGVLQTFARLAGAEMRHTDVLARWGGEEFLMLLPMTPEAMATSALERLRTTLADMPASASMPGLRVTFSAGVAMRRPGDTAQSLIERADRAMYKAKRQGRDQTVVDRAAPAPFRRLRPSSPSGPP